MEHSSSKNCRVSFEVMAGVSVRDMGDLVGVIGVISSMMAWSLDVMVDCEV